MKNSYLILYGIVFSLIGICTIASYKEHGDSNSIIMYLTVYFIPAIGLGIINGFFLKFVEKKTIKLISKIGLGLLPLGILIGFFFSGNFRMNFIAEFGLIGIGLTNLIWISKNALIENKKASA